MPSVNHPGTGIAQYVPGVYSQTVVESDLAGPAPTFHIPIIVGEADEGHPYNADDAKYAHEDPFTPFKLLKTTGAVGRYFGPRSDLAKMCGFAKRHGLPFAWFVAINALTRASVIAHSTGPVVEMTIYASKHGAPGGHIKLAVAANNSLTVIPVKHFALLTVDASSGDKRVYVKDNSWIRDGMTVSVGDNAQANATIVVASHGSETDSTGQVVYWVQFTTGLAADQDIADDAMLVEYDTTATQASGELDDGQAVYDWLNDTCNVLGAKKEATFANADLLTTSSLPIKEISAWGTATAGTSPAATDTQHDDFVADLDATEWDGFVLREQATPRVFCVGSSNSTVHATWRDYAIAKRTAGEPVHILAGTAWGDTSTTATNDTSPNYRTASLNCQDFDLCAGGLDKEAAYLSMAPAVLGRLVEGGLGHNLTNDVLVFTELEKRWDERTLGQLTTLTRAGVITQKLSQGRTAAYKISQGINTLQNNTLAWNTGTNDTPLRMQRDLADDFDRDMGRTLEGEQIGADGVTKDSIAAVLLARAEQRVQRGLLTAGTYRISAIDLLPGGAGYAVDHTGGVPTTTDFITMTTRILVGQE